MEEVLGKQGQRKVRKSQKLVSREERRAGDQGQVTDKGSRRAARWAGSGGGIQKWMPCRGRCPGETDVLGGRKMRMEQEEIWINETLKRNEEGTVRGLSICLRPMKVFDLSSPGCF